MAHRVSSSAVAVAAILLGVGGAQAADYIPEEPVMIEQPVIEYAPPPYYSRVDCAASFNRTTNLRVGRPEVHFIEKNGGSVSTTSGWACGVGFGVYFTEHLRGDVTMEYRGEYNFSGVADPTFPTPPPESPLSQAGDVDSFVTLFNAYLDIAHFGGVTPYIGAGIGFAYNNMSDVFIRESGFSTRGDSNTDFAWALMAGLVIELSPDLKLDTNYRYINWGDAISGTTGSDGSINLPPIIARDMSAHEIRVGIRYDFY